MSAAGTLTKVAEGRYTLRFERMLAHPVEKVWRAVTDRAELAHWFPGDVEIDYRLGGAVRWTFPDFGVTLPEGRVTAYDPPHLLEYTVSSKGMPFVGTDEERTIRYELSPDPAGCRLVFTNTFGDLAGAGSFAAGWHGCLAALTGRLDGTPVPDGAPAGAMHEEYVRRFGLDEGTARRNEDGWTVRFERQLWQPVDTVWSALAGANGSAPAPGDPPPATLTNAFAPTGVVTHVQPPTVVEYDTPAGPVRWELALGPGGARVTLSHRLPAALGGQRAVALAAWRDHLERLADRLGTQG
jgi:uncharacterized protein YndB with AHSA1/START domain